MLNLTRIINKGGRRLCMEHPDDPDKCVKVIMFPRDLYLLKRDLEAYKAVKPILKDFLPYYHEELVETQLGPGLICEIVKDDDGSVSRRLADYVQRKLVNKRTLAQLAIFARLVTENGIPFYDMNPNNFLVQIKNGKQRLLYVDLKYYGIYKPWVYLHMEKFIPALSRLIVKRRLKRLFDWLEKHPQTEDRG